MDFGRNSTGARIGVVVIANQIADQARQESQHRQDGGDNAAPGGGIAAQAITAAIVKPSATRAPILKARMKTGRGKKRMGIVHLLPPCPCSIVDR